MYVNNNLSNRNPPYAEKTSGAPYGLPNFSYVLGSADNKKGTASGDVYYIAVNSKGRLYGGAQVNNATDITWEETATKDDLDSKLELVTTGFLPLTAATIQPNSYTYFTFEPTLPSGYILVGACLKDTNALASKVAPVYCNASSSNGTHRINFRLANTSDDPVSITASMGVAFYLFVRKR